MPRKKSLRVAELTRMPNVFLPPQAPEGALKDFATRRPLVLDLGCGRGETTVGMAARDPDRHYLGVDLKAARLHRGAEAAGRLGLTNVAFAVLSILKLQEVLPERICDEGWLLFPDPFIKQRAAKHRLTSPAHLAAYRRLLRVGASLHLRTDSLPLFEYSLRAVQQAGFSVRTAATLLPPYPEEGVGPPVHSKYEARFRREGRALHDLVFRVT